MLKMTGWSWRNSSQTRWLRFQLKHCQMEKFSICLSTLYTY